MTKTRKPLQDAVGKQTEYSLSLADRIREGRKKMMTIGARFVPPATIEAYHSALANKLLGIPVIVADNVDSFLWLTLSTKQSLKPKDVPNLVPVFPECWIEYRTGSPTLQALDVHRVGCYAQMDTPTAKLSENPGFAHLFRFSLFAETAHAICAHVHEYWVVSDEDGIAQRAEIQVAEGLDEAMAPLPDESESKYLAGLSTTALMCISFLNCRNVSLLPGMKAPRALAQARKRRHHPDLVAQHIVNITPMSRIIAAAANDGAAGDADTSARMLHIVRGHFKRYSEGGKLFGRLFGRFFFPSHVRGGGADKNLSCNESARYTISFKGRNTL